MTNDTATHTTPMRRTALLMLAFVGVLIVSIFTVVLPELSDEDPVNDAVITAVETAPSEPALPDN